MNRTTRTLVATATLALALTATGCGTGTGGGTQAVQQAAELAPEALLKLVGEKMGSEKSAKVDSSLDLATGSMTMKGSLDWHSGLQGSLTGKAQGGPMGQALAQAGGDGTFQARYLSDAYYVNMGDGMAAKLQGKHWLRYGYADMAKLMGPAGESMKNQFKTADPVTAVRTLIAGGKVTKAGTDTINGTKVTKYSGDITADEIAAASAKSGLTDEQVTGLKQQFQAAGITTDHIDVWVSGDNLLVKKVEQMQTKAGQLTSTAVYSDYGTPVTVQAPDASDTVDFAEIMKQAQAQGGAKG